MDSIRTVVRDVARGGEPSDRREVAAIGRMARLELAFEKRRGRTVLARGYAEPPFRIGRALEIDDAAYVIIVCSEPGIFPGDALRQPVHLGPGARAVLTSQAALQAHPGVAQTIATIDHRYTLEDNAELHCHWDPVIPFAGSRLAQRFDVQMPSSARVSWIDGVMAGRVTRGERWRFRELSYELRLRVDGSLRYLERYRLVPEERAATRTWMAGDADYVGTALLYHERATAEVAESMQRELGQVPEVCAAADLVEPRLLVGRFMAERGVPFVAARAAWRRFALETVFESPHLAGRKSPLDRASGDPEALEGSV